MRHVTQPNSVTHGRKNDSTDHSRKGVQLSGVSALSEQCRVVPLFGTR